MKRLTTLLKLLSPPTAKLKDNSLFHLLRKLDKSPFLNPLRRGYVMLLCLLLLAACGGLAGEPEIVATLRPVTAAPPEAAFPPSPPDLAAGSQLFAEHCTDCHGPAGAGDGELVLTGQVSNPGDFTGPDAARSQTPLQWFSTITNGRIQALMPPWRNALNAQQRWDVALYTYTLHYTPEQIDQGQAVWEETCGDNCDSLPEIGSLSDAQTMASISDAELRAALPASISSEDDAWAAVAYLRTAMLENVAAVAVDNLQQPAPPVAQTEEAVASPAAEVAAPADGAIIGQVVNASAGGETPAGITARLFRWDSEFAPLDTVTTETDDEGRFRFESVELDPTHSYAVAVDYRERRFVSEFLRGTSNPLELPVTIYELTEDPAVITIRGIVSQMTAVGNGVQVVQVIHFQNDSDRVYTTSDEVTEGMYASVIISLPPGATVIGFPGNEQRYIVSEDQTTVVDTLPVVPGENHLVQLVYLVPYEGDAIIDQPLNYALDGEVRLLLRPDTLEVISETLPFMGPQTLGENTFKGYGGTLQMDADDVLSFELRGAPAPAAAQIEQPDTLASNNLALIVVLVLVVQAVVIGGLYLYYRRRGARQQDDTRLIDALVRQIAELDDAHDKGEINHDVYQRQRGMLKQRLAELMGEDDEQ